MYMAGSSREDITEGIEITLTLLSKLVCWEISSKTICNRWNELDVMRNIVVRNAEAICIKILSFS